MTQILNVSMPADEAIKIIGRIFESNRMVRIRVALLADSLGDYIVETITVEDFEVLYLTYATRPEKIQIVSITPILPTYSVGQEVMILATGEIGEIKDCWSKAKLYITTQSSGGSQEPYHRSEICKIA